MAEVPARNRKNEIAERKVVCPFCGRNNLTYRKIVKHCLFAHQDEMKVVGIRCQAEGCGYLCNKGIKCFKNHLKNVHANNKTICYKLCKVEATVTKHSEKCNIMFDKVVVEIQKKFIDAEERKKEREMKKRFII